MSVSLQARVAGRGRSPGPAVAVSLAGLGFLLARPGLEGLPTGGRTAVLAGGYLALAGAGAASALQSARWASATRAGLALAAGLAAVVAVALLAGPAPPLGGGATALALSLVAAVAEEALFRGALYGALRRWGAPVAIVGSALLFGLVHLPSYGLAALPVDLGAGLLLGWQRWVSGRWTVPAATHAAANLLAVILR